MIDFRTSDTQLSSLWRRAYDILANFWAEHFREIPECIPSIVYLEFDQEGRLQKEESTSDLLASSQASLNPFS